MFTSQTSDVFDKVLKILYAHDPLGLVPCGVPEDEYSPEAKLIAQSLHECQNVDITTALVHAVFWKMFDEDAGGYNDYIEISKEIFALK